MSFINLLAILKGGSGSGNWGHSGRPGNRGGSLPKSGTGAAMSLRTGPTAAKRQAEKKGNSGMNPPTREAILQEGMAEANWSRPLMEEFLDLSGGKTGYMMTQNEFVNRPTGVYTIGVKGANKRVPVDLQAKRLEENVEKARQVLQDNRIGHLEGVRPTEFINWRLNNKQKKLVTKYNDAYDAMAKHRRENAVRDAKALHKAVVEQAFEKGKYIPPEVLAEYNLSR